MTRPRQQPAFSFASSREKNRHQCSRSPLSIKRSSGFPARDLPSATSCLRTATAGRGACRPWASRKDAKGKGRGGCLVFEQGLRQMPDGTQGRCSGLRFANLGPQPPMFLSSGGLPAANLLQTLLVLTIALVTGTRRVKGLATLPRTNTLPKSGFSTPVR